VAPRRLVLLGHPVAHSLSPRCQSAALRAAGLNVAYDALDIAPDALADVLRRLLAEGTAGNVTVPHKEPVARICDDLTPIAKRIGAVNVFWVDDGRLIGDNTDAGGFAAASIALRGAPVAPGRSVGVLGAGGAAAAVLAALGEWPSVDVRVWNRHPARAETLAKRFGVRAVATKQEAVRGVDLVVNATSIGLGSAEHPVDVGMLSAGTDVIDLVYSPNETSWVRAARAAGHRASDGLEMLIEQGALAFERWFDRPPDRAAMWRAVAPDRNRFTASS
jgi:shikimate dehydrogenase